MITRRYFPVIIVLFILLISSSNLVAKEWAGNSIDGDTPRSLLPISNNRLLVGAHNYGLSIYDLTTEEWTKINLPGEVFGEISIKGFSRPHPASDTIIANVQPSNGHEFILFRTVDGGENWIASAEGLPDLSGSYCKTAFDPFNPEKVLWAGRPLYLYESMDAGSTWAEIAGEELASRVEELTFSQQIPGLLFSGAEIFDFIEFEDTTVVVENGGLRRSRDGGSEWETIDISGDPHILGMYSRVSSIVEDPFDPAFWMVGLSDSRSRNILWTSADTGSTWELRTTGLGNQAVVNDI